MNILDENVPESQRLVCLGVGQYEVGSFVRRFLRHPAFSTRSKRMGKVIRAAHVGIQVWQLHAEKETAIAWIHDAANKKPIRKSERVK